MGNFEQLEREIQYELTVLEVIDIIEKTEEAVKVTDNKVVNSL